MNRTFLNGVELRRRTRVLPGDRITIGSSDIDVIERYTEATTSAASGAVDSGRVPIASTSGQPSGWVTSKASPEPAPASGPQTRALTVNVETFESAGRLADRMFAAGRPHAARRILEEPLEDILDAARRGATLDSALVDAAGWYAVRLAQAVPESRWLDIAIEIHAIACRPLQRQTLQQFMSLREKRLEVSSTLMAAYYVRLRSRLASMNTDERKLCERIGALVAGLRVKE